MDDMYPQKGIKSNEMSGIEARITLRNCRNHAFPSSSLA